MGFISFIFSTIFGIIGFIFSVILYILTAFGLYTLSKRDGIPHAWIAWIPICQLYLIGALINDKVLGLNNAKWILVLAPIVAGIICSFLNSDLMIGIVQLLVYILEASAYYKLFMIYKPERAMLYLITGFIITPLLGLYTFLIRNNPRHQIAN